MKKLAKINQSIEKTFNIIEIMAEGGEPLRLQDIALKVDMPASTVLRLVNTLVSCGYAYQDSNTLKYSLSLKFMQIGGLVSSQTRIRDIAHPYLLEISKKSKESVCLAIEHDMEVLYLDVIDGPGGMLRITQRIGKIAPLHSTAVGKILMLNYDAKQLNQLIAIKGLTALTPNTITDKESLIKEINKIEMQGYAIDDEECELGARCISAGIKDYSGKYIAGISVSGPTTRMSMEYINTIKNIVIDSAKIISKQLAYKE
jgi:DNA-binding IclR family transcriptional regulator